MSLLHDSELSLVRIDRAAKTVDLGFRHEDGSTSNFTFAGVVHIRLSETWLQNVVSRAFLVPRQQLPVEEVRRILSWIFSMGDKLAIEEEGLSRHVDDVMRRSKTLFYAEPSWGAEIGVLSTTVVCSDD